mmetsp:Transcript_977/g.1960  ORF Transcript_977/g.1960 Transcript_977/m.1960 type:complete len:214 (+) Transcript_977:806-1447(+)
MRLSTVASLSLAFCTEASGFSFSKRYKYIRSMGSNFRAASAGVSHSCGTSFAMRGPKPSRLHSAKNNKNSSSLSLPPMTPSRIVNNSYISSIVVAGSSCFRLLDLVRVICGGLVSSGGGTSGVGSGRLPPSSSELELLELSSVSDSPMYTPLLSPVIRKFRNSSRSSRPLRSTSAALKSKSSDLPRNASGFKLFSTSSNSAGLMLPSPSTSTS